MGTDSQQQDDGGGPELARAKWFDDFWRRVNGALKCTIDAHGPITRENYGSAGKRIAKQITPLQMTVRLERRDEITALGAFPGATGWLSLVRAQREYIELLTAELSEVSPLLAIHGWSSKRTEAGRLAREKIVIAEAASNKKVTHD